LLAAEEKARQDAIIAKFKKVEPELPPEIPLDVEYIEATKRIADETAKVEKQLAGQQNVEIGGAAVALPKGKPPTPVVNERTKKIADKRVVAALFAQFNEQKARTTFEEPTDAAGEDVGIKVGAMSRDGKLGIGFNQPLVVPPFNSDSASKGRSLGISVEELDVTRDVLNFEYVSGSGDGDIAYDIFISKWDESGISLQLNFSDPLAVSQGRGNDRAVVAIKNPGLFVSKKTGKMIQAENAVAVQKVPR
jgi:non-canonical (house-cleaning) NTP pyrophosphatase